nr:hypothetical protein [Tanacetum cinerariifolium]
CETKIYELTANVNKISNEINKNKDLRQLEQIANLSTHTPKPSRHFNFTYDDDDDYEESPLNEISSQIPPSITITPVLPTNEPEDSLIMGNEELSTIPEKESHKFIKSSVEDLFPIPSDPNPSSDPVVTSLSPSLTPTGDSDSIMEETDTLHDLTSPEFDEDIFNPEGDIRLLDRLLNLDSIKDIPPTHELNNEIFDPEGDILFFENLLKNDPSEAKSFEIDSLIKGPSDTVLIGDEDINLNSPMNVDNFVPIPRVSEKPLDMILEASKTTITDLLFDFDSEFTLNSNNPILDIQNKESDEFNTET